tara:strand:- start:1248 stop:1589 length:342 start_codon:yes stop_codon:yes gene_type:complete
MTKHSTGFNLTGGVANTILTVPTGYDAEITFLFIVNAGNSTKTVTATWHNNVNVIFLSGKSVTASDHVEFGGPFGAFLILREGDYMTVEPEAGSTFSAIISYNLYPSAPRFNI